MVTSGLDTHAQNHTNMYTYTPYSEWKLVYFTLKKEKLKLNPFKIAPSGSTYDDRAKLIHLLPKMEKGKARDKYPTVPLRS